MDLFQYSLISLDRPALRLIRLRAARAEPGIHCEFIEAFFDEDVPDYEAISYTWGSLHTPSEIRLNGSKFAITENLFSVLQDVRYQDEDRILWIDAICIDQGSHSELGHQVQQMDQIYQRAHRVIIWLGPLTDSVGLLMDSLANLQSQMPGIDWTPTDPRWPISRKRLKDSSTEALTTLAQIFLDILQRPWFRRVWVIQEVANARAALVHCGHKSVTARVFAACPKLLGVQAVLDHETSEYAKIAFPHCQAILDVMPGPSGRDSWWNQNRDLRTLLTKFSDSEATREHDRVFALLCLCPEANAKIPVDYTQGIDELARKVLSYIYSCEPRYLESIHCASVKVLVEDLDKLCCQILGSLLRHSEPSIIDAFMLKNREHLTFTKDLFPAAMTNKHHMRYCFSVVLELYQGFGAEVSEAARILDSIVAKGSTADVEIFLHHISACDSEVGSDANSNRSSLPGLMPLPQLTSDAGSEAIMASSPSRGILLPGDPGARRKLLLQAIERGQENLARLLIDLGVELESQDFYGYAPLVVASTYGNEAIVRLLLDRGIDCNQWGRRGDTAIIMASTKGHESVARLLIDRGADCDIGNAADETPLSRATFFGHKAIVQLLLDQGVDFKAKRCFQLTPLSFSTLR